MQSWAGLPQLVTLLLGDTEVRDFSPLLEIETLRGLGVTGSGLTDTEIAQLEAFVSTSLRSAPPEPQSGE